MNLKFVRNKRLSLESRLYDIDEIIWKGLIGSNRLLCGKDIQIYVFYMEKFQKLWLN